MDRGGCIALVLFVLAVLIAMVLSFQGGNSGALILDQRGLALVDRGLDDLRLCLCLVCGVAGEPSTLSAFLAQ